MRRFAALYAALDETTRTNEKVAALVEYFSAAPPADAAWAAYFLIGRRPRRVISARELSAWAAQLAEIPDWLFSECYDAVGDIAETITLLLPEAQHEDERPLAEWIETKLLPLQTMDETSRKAAIFEAWACLSTRQRFIWNKLITGGFRVGVSQRLVTRALAQVNSIDEATVAHRLMGDWEPSAAFFTALTAPEISDADISRPYPFFLAYPLEDTPEALGPITDWQVEWKWDGIRAQAIKRAGRVFLWSRGEELVTDRYPEIAAEAERLPDGTALDGELLPWDLANDRVLPFAQLQRRIGRKTLGKKLLQEVPVVYLAYDLLEREGEDIRAWPLRERRAALEALVAALAGFHLRLSPLVTAGSWEALAVQRAESRERQVEGFMLKRLDSPYRVGRRRGDWWKWKVEPYTIDAVLIYAQRGSGKRASLYTDYTFAIWDDDGQLLPFAKAYSGLTDEEIREVDRFIRRNTNEKFGPVRAVKPELVFELAFEGIQRSPRHKSGIAVRFPRILRWRRDKRIEEADSLKTLAALLPET
ncbi:MAG: ATP-dependent DNA ligase [Aggregatilineales bacterium]